MMSFAVGTNEQLPMWEGEVSGATKYDAADQTVTRRSTANGELDRQERVVLSIITSMYKSAPFLERFYKRISAVASQITSNFEIIFVNDGSPDNSLEVALELQEQDPRIVVVDLSRNFGQHKAVMTALRQARGDYVFRIHCDLDEPPEVLHFFYQDLKKLGVDSVFGVQEKREGGFAKNYLGGLFYHVFNMLSPIRIPENQLSCRLMTRRYVDALLQYQEHQIYMAGLFAMVGFEQHAVTVVKKEHGTSTYTLRKRLHMMATAITSFSLRPLLVIPIIGAIVFGLSILAAIIGGITHLSGLLPTSGWFWVIDSIWGGTGLVLSCMGIIAVYLINMMTEVKCRPYTTVRQVYKRESGRLPGSQQVSTGSHSTHDGVR
jgi:Glycosyltransferases involved in cell wall biogenesis